MLPVELWRITFDCIRTTKESYSLPGCAPDTQTLKNVRLTCRLFEQIANDFFYERIGLGVPTDRRLAERIQSPQIACFIQYLTIFRLITYNEIAGEQSYLDILTPSKLKRLRGLLLEDVYVDSSRLLDLVMSPQLEHACLDNVCFTEGSPPLDFQQIDVTALRLRHLRFMIKPNAPVTPLCLKLSTAPSISSLSIYGRIEIWFAGLPTVSTSLQTFETPIPQGSNFTNSPIGPRVESLTLEQWCQWEKPLSPPSLDVLPILRRYKGDWVAAAALVPGRPVERVDLRSVELSQIGELCAALGKSSGPLTVLHAICAETFWKDDVLASIAKYMPSLREIDLNIHYVENAPLVRLQRPSMTRLHKTAD